MKSSYVSSLVLQGFKIYKGLSLKLEYGDVIKQAALGTQKFLISQDWWSKWCDYTNFQLMFGTPNSKINLLNDAQIVEDVLYPHEYKIE